MSMDETCSKCGAGIEPDALFCAGCGASISATRPLSGSLIGQQIIGQYRIKALIGQGGMGVAYLAEQVSMGRDAVVKVMHPEISRDPQVAPRFEIEARAASQLSHPNIITIYNFGAMEDGTLFMAMEHCEGESMEEALTCGPMAPRRAALIGVQIAEALDEAHRRGVVHRDLKPSNIILRETGVHRDFVKVLDFGLAKLEGVKMTRTGALMGTPQYMSPEQYRGAPADGRSDLYSLGVMLFEMVSGRLPFVSQSMMGYMNMHLNEAPPRPGDVLGREVPPSLERVVLRLLEKDPARRYGNAREVRAALLASDSQPPAALAERPAPRRRIGLWVGVGGAGVGLVTAALATALLLRPGARTPAAPPVPAWRALPAGTRAAPMPDVARGRPDTSVEPSPDVRPPRTSRPRNRTASRRTVGPPPVRSPAPVRAVRPEVAGPAPVKRGKEEAVSAEVARLETKLRKVMSNARTPPSSVDRTLKTYRVAMKHVPAALRETATINYLARMIRNFEAMKLAPYERRSVAHLSRQIMTMETRVPMTPQKRKQEVDGVIRTFDRGSFLPEDRSYYKRQMLLSLIRKLAKDPGRELR